MKCYRAMLKQLAGGMLSCNAIAKQRSMSHHTVRRAARIREEQELTSAQIDISSDEELSAIFYPNRRPSGRFVDPDWQEIHTLIRQGFTRLMLHEQYSRNTGLENAMSYREFCRRFEAYVQTLDPVMRIDHAPGYALQTDYAGYAPLAREHRSREVFSFKLFVATLPFSRLIAASIVRSEKTNDHIEANMAALTYIGGAPVVLVPDNLKAAVLSRPRHGSPRINPEYQGFADHYGIGIDPARPRRPQDKSAVENSVKLVQRSLRLHFHDRPVPTLTQLREALARIVEALNAKPLRRANGHSRRSLFEAEERGHLQPLPIDPYQIADARTEARVGKDYHVAFKGCYYSVPHRWIGETISVAADSRTVRISRKGLEVAIHPRLHGAGEASTHAEHRPVAHRAASCQDIREWAASYSEPVRIIAASETANSQTPRLKKQYIEWIKGLPRRFTRRRFEMACKRAVELDDLRFKHVENVLLRGIEAAPSGISKGARIEAKGNVRGAGYYGGKGTEL